MADICPYYTSTGCRKGDLCEYYHVSKRTDMYIKKMRANGFPYAYSKPCLSDLLIGNCVQSCLYFHIRNDERFINTDRTIKKVVSHPQHMSNHNLNEYCNALRDKNYQLFSELKALQNEHGKLRRKYEKLKRDKKNKNEKSQDARVSDKHKHRMKADSKKNNRGALSPLWRQSGSVSPIIFNDGIFDALSIDSDKDLSPKNAQMVLEKSKKIENHNPDENTTAG